MQEVHAIAYYFHVSRNFSQVDDKRTCYNIAFGTQKNKIIKYHFFHLRRPKSKVFSDSSETLRQRCTFVRKYFVPNMTYKYIISPKEIYDEILYWSSARFLTDNIKQIFSRDGDISSVTFKTKESSSASV